MKIENFANIVEPSIPLDVDRDFIPEYSGRKVLFNKELVLKDKTLKTVYLNNHVRIIVLNIENSDIYEVYIYNYSPENRWQAYYLDGNIEEIEKLGGLNEFVYELVIGEKNLFSHRGSSISI